jgi:hypothetical protein
VIQAVEAAREASQMYTTAELSTINPACFPVTVPVLPAFDEAAGKIVVSTSIAYSAKARNIGRNPDVLFYYHSAVALRPEIHDREAPDTYCIRAKARVVDQDFPAALAAIGYYFRATKTQPGLYKRLRHRLWRRLYRYYFTRMLIEADPQEVTDGVALSSSPECKAKPRLAVRRIRRVGRVILRRARTASLTISDPVLGLSACEVRIQAVFPGQVCAEIPEDALGGIAERSSSIRRNKTYAKACISAFGQSSDLSTLYHSCVIGIASISGSQVRLYPRTSFTTLRPPGVVGDLWTGIHSSIEGAKAAAKLGVMPISEAALERAFRRET